MSPGLHLSLAILALTGAACEAKSHDRVVAESAAIEQLVAEHPGWHVGTDADCKSPHLAQMQHDQPGYAPYRAHGDFNGDGVEDAVVVLMRGDSGLIYWFRGQASGFGEPHQVGALGWASDAGLFVRERTLSFGQFYSDMIFDWAWDSASGNLKFVPQPSDSTHT